MVEALFEQRAMRGYVRETMPCDAIAQVPSKDLRKRYGLQYGYNNLEVWAILEMYANGELVHKEKEND
jgi:hypothetical protein